MDLARVKAKPASDQAARRSHERLYMSGMRTMGRQYYGDQKRAAANVELDMNNGLVTISRPVFTNVSATHDTICVEFRLMTSVLITRRGIEGPGL